MPVFVVKKHLRTKNGTHFSVNTLSQKHFLLYDYRNHQKITMEDSESTTTNLLILSVFLKNDFFSTLSVTTD